MQEVSAAAIQQKEMDFKEYKNQKFNKSRKKKIGRPKFKKKAGRQSYRLPNQKFAVLEEHIKLEKIGCVKIVKDREIPDDVKYVNVTVSRNPDGRYFASILVEEQVADKPKTGRTVGVDVGLKSFAELSDGTVVANPRYFRNSQAKLAKLQRRLSRKKGSKKGEKKSVRYRKLRARINRLHAQIVNQRKHFIHNLSKTLVEKYDVVTTEDLNVIGMLRNHKLAKSISDAAWSELFRQLDYKCEWYGKEHRKADRFYPSSQIHFECGFRNRNLKLSDRTWLCPNCGDTVDRDINAAKNLNALGVDSAERTQSSTVTSGDEAFRVPLE